MHKKLSFQTMSVILTYPLPKMMAFGGVDTGNRNLSILIKLSFQYMAIIQSKLRYANAEGKRQQVINRINTALAS